MQIGANPWQKRKSLNFCQKLREDIDSRQDYLYYDNNDPVYKKELIQAVERAFEETRGKTKKIVVKGPLVLKILKKIES